MRKELLDTGRWEITKKQSTTQPSFIRTDFMDGAITNDTWQEIKMIFIFFIILLLLSNYDNNIWNETCYRGPIKDEWVK